jgi:carbon monoxide dehydrogenase subunit G
MEITRTVETSTPIDKVFSYLSDFTTTNEWDPGTVRTVRVSGVGGVGTQYDNTSRFNGRETQLEYVVTELVPDSRIILEGSNKTVRATDTIALTSVDAGTRVTYNARFEFKGLTRYLVVLLSPVLRRAFKKLGDEAEAGLRSALDAL